MIVTDVADFLRTRKLEVHKKAWAPSKEKYRNECDVEGEFQVSQRFRLIEYFRICTTLKPWSASVGEVEHGKRLSKDYWTYWRARVSSKSVNFKICISDNKCTDSSWKVPEAQYYQLVGIIM